MSCGSEIHLGGGQRLGEWADGHTPHYCRTDTGDERQNMMNLFPLYHFHHIRCSKVTLLYSFKQAYKSS